jgi:hypothetical protein
MRFLFAVYSRLAQFPGAIWLSAETARQDRRYDVFSGRSMAVRFVLRIQPTAPHKLPDLLEYLITLCHT